MNLAFDLDGCLVEFNEAYARMLIEESGEDKFPKGWEDNLDLLCPVWGYDKHFGYAEATTTAVVQKIASDPSFWTNLRPIFGARAALRNINALTKKGHDIYFITTRFGVGCKRQTEQWLHDMGVDFPTVIISANKPPVLQGLNVDLFIDDRLTTVIAASTVIPKTKLALLDRPYNREGRDAEIPVVKTVLDALIERGICK